MANLAPSAEKAVEKDAASALDGSQNGSPSARGSVNVVMGVNVSLAPPETWCKKTWDESPTERTVRASGESEAGRDRYSLEFASPPKKAWVRTVVYGNV